jgi:hypothetical protein
MQPWVQTQRYIEIVSVSNYIQGPEGPQIPKLITNLA